MNKTIEKSSLHIFYVIETVKFGSRNWKRTPVIGSLLDEKYAGLRYFTYFSIDGFHEICEVSTGLSVGHGYSFSEACVKFGRLKNEKGEENFINQVLSMQKKFGQINSL